MAIGAFTVTRMVRYRPFPSSGFTLVEVLIAMVILSVGLLAVAGMMGIAIQANAYGSKLSLANRSAQQKLEELKNADYATVVTYADAADANGLTRSWTVTNDTPIANTKTIVTSVTWTDSKGRSRAVQFSTVISP